MEATRNTVAQSMWAAHRHGAEDTPFMAEVARGGDITLDVGTVGRIAEVVGRQTFLHA
jgi:hypothetical protein